MESVVLHVDREGAVWLIAKCRACGEVHKYLASDACAGPVSCKSCCSSMYMAGAKILGGDRGTDSLGQRVPNGSDRQNAAD